MNEKHHEWLKQSDYDMGTADAMFASGRYLYAVFMCHLSIEKSLKGMYSKDLAEVPPKTHNLIYLLKKIGKKPHKDMLKFITKLNTASVAMGTPMQICVSFEKQRSNQNILRTSRRCSR